MKQLLKYPLLLAFFVFIFGYSLFDMTQNSREYSEFENKYLAQKPEFTMKSFLNNEFTPKYESYINDQFALRDDWITLKSLCETALMKIENNGITYGKDDYLFEKFTAIPGDQYQRNLGFLGEFFAKYTQQPITFAVIPNAYTIYPERIPKGLHNVDQLVETQKIYQQAEQSGGENLKILDFYDTLLAHKSEYLYYRTDHHWTTTGAYYAYAQYVQSLGRTPVALEEMPANTVEGFYGTYFSKAKKFAQPADTITWYDIPVSQTVIDGKEYDGYYDKEKFAVRDKYAAFLRGNNGFTVLKSAVNRDAVPGQTSKVLVIKDSYANSFVPFLLYHFDEVHIVDLRANEKQISEILQENTYEDILLMYNFMNLTNDTNIYRLKY